MFNNKDMYRHIKIITAPKCMNQKLFKQHKILYNVALKCRNWLITAIYKFLKHN